MDSMLKTGTLFGVGHYSRLGHYSNNYGNKYFYWIYQLPTDVQKILKIGRFLGEKLRFFAFIKLEFQYHFFNRKILQSVCFVFCIYIPIYLYYNEAIFYWIITLFTSQKSIFSQFLLYVESYRGGGDWVKKNILLILGLFGVKTYH